MNFKTFWNDFKNSKWYSRKLLVTIAGAIAVILFPDSDASIVSIIGLFCGANVAQKFSISSKEIGEAVKSINEVALATEKKPI